MEKTETIKSIKILLGDSSLISPEQCDECYETAVGDFELFSSVSQKSEEELQKIRRIWIKKYAISVAKEIIGRTSILIHTSDKKTHLFYLKKLFCMNLNTRRISFLECV
jgi:hypothetical protein